MLDFVVKNYLIIVIVGAFLIFALIGFAVDSVKNKNNKESELLTESNEDADTTVLEESVNQVSNEEQTDVASLDSPNVADNGIPEADTVNMNTGN